MVSIEFDHSNIARKDLLCQIIFITEDKLKEKSEELNALATIDVNQVIQSINFTASPLSTTLIPLFNNQHPAYCLLVGLGKKDKGIIDVELYRRAIGKAIRAVEGYKFKSILLQLPLLELFGLSLTDLVEQTVIAIQMAAYSFEKFVTDDKKKKSLKHVIIDPNNHDMNALSEGLRLGSIISEGVNLARYWVDLPPIELTPIDLAKKARLIAEKEGLKYTMFGEEEVQKMGMGGLSAVSAGSDRDAALVVLEYHCAKQNAPTLGFVGKGITFDSGGLSIKPAQYMETMKEDMSGAAAVIAAMRVIGVLKPDINVIAVTPMAENLPSGKAIKPGDIVQFYNGKTAEIKNTDAEGRLILADALSYLEKNYKVDAIIDIATLTGACAYALGPFFSGLMSNNEDLVDRIEKAAKHSGDAVWRLPLTADYKKAIDSPIADMSNIGSRQYMAGATTAGHFLAEFVEKAPWAHLDIAGTAFNVPDIAYYRPETATGVGVRLLVDIALNWK